VAVCKEVLLFLKEKDGSLAGNLYIQGRRQNLKGKEVRVHHTKVKADIGFANVISDLVEKGYVPCIPISEHQHYDLLAVLKDGEVVKIQVKYAHLKKNGTIEVKFRTSWVDKKGTHTRRYKKEDFDYYAIYCPEKEKVLYVPNAPNCPKAIRFDKPSNNQSKYIKWASAYFDIKGSSETIRRRPEMAKT